MEKRNNLYSKIVYKLIPIILTILVLFCLWFGFFTSHFQEMVKDFIFYFLDTSSFTVFLMSGLMYLLGLTVIVCMVGGLFFVITKGWIWYCKYTSIIKTEETKQVIRILEKSCKKNESTTILNINGSMYPVNSEYTTHYLSLQIGTKDKIIIEKKVTEDEYNQFYKTHDYLMSFRNEKIFGITVNFDVNISSAVEL